MNLENDVAALSDARERDSDVCDELIRLLGEYHDLNADIIDENAQQQPRQLTFYGMESERD